MYGKMVQGYPRGGSEERARILSVRSGTPRRTTRALRDAATLAHHTPSYRRKGYHDRGTLHRRNNDGDKQDRSTVDIIISNASDKPIYEQITAQMKNLILSGTLVEGAQLPSMRALANDLRISVITTKRAYADLEAQGFIETVQGKGSFVSGGNMELLREERLKHIEELMARAVDEARSAGVSALDLHDMLDLLLED